LTTQPNDKQALLDAENYEIFNRDLMRKVFPRIIAEVRAQKPRAKVGDVIPFYFALLAYIDGNERRASGEANGRFGYSFPSQARLYEMTGIDRKRHAMLTDLLRENGLITDMHRTYEGMRHYIWYRPAFCANISDDGYVINANGERVVPDYSSVTF
jgi:hypothetical protein